MIASGPFVRIIYHYMGLPFLCMLGSLRITGRLLHIFKTPVPDLPLSFPFGSFLVRRWISTILNASQWVHFIIPSNSDLCASFFIPIISENLQLLFKRPNEYYIFKFFHFHFFLIPINQTSFKIPSRPTCCGLFHVPKALKEKQSLHLVGENTSLTMQQAIMGKCQGHVLMILSL